MKTIKNMALLACLVLISSVILVSGQGTHEPGTGIEDPELKEATQGTGNAQPVTISAGNGSEPQQIQAKEQVRTQIDTLKQSMQQTQQQLNTATQDSDEKVQAMIRNQNQVKIAAQTLSQMENMLGNKGSQIAAIAREFDNSVQSTMKSEEKIQTRSAFSRFFAGGDKKAAEELEAETTKNQERIQELKQLKDEADCDEEVKTMMQEQIQQMENEQVRLEKLAQKEKESKGLFGWMWK